MTIVNAITSLRIIGTFCMIFTEPLTWLFFIIYTISGITDVLDGFIARKTNSATEFGARLDSIADLFFYLVMIYKLFPELWGFLPAWIWCAAIFVIVIRFVAYGITAVKQHRFMSNHTYLNKLTGFCAFLIPYALKFSNIGLIHCTITCIVLITSSLYELFLSINPKETNKMI